MRSFLLWSLISVSTICQAIAQQSPTPLSSPPVGSTSNTFPSSPPAATPPRVPSRLACAAICSKSFTETSLSADDKKWFDQCAGALLCQGKVTPPLVWQPRPYPDQPDNFLGGIPSYLTKKYHDWIS
jgi:hypothetical protein